MSDLSASTSTKTIQDDMQNARTLRVEMTTSAGFDRKETNLHDLQLHPETLDSISGVDEGDFLKVSTSHDGDQMECYGRVEARDDRFQAPIEADAIGLGIDCRTGIGVAIGDTVTVEPVGFEPVRPTNRLLNRLMKFRPATCRVRKATAPDSGYKVCRLAPEVKDLIGIEWGDRIVIQSPNARLRGMKALPLRDTLEEKFSERERRAPAKYPPPFSETEIAQEAGITGDIPRIHISAAARNDLELAGDEVYQPVKVHRDTTDVFIRLFETFTIPLLLVAVTIMLAFELGRWFNLLVLLGVVVIVVISISLHGRRILLE